MAKSLLLTLSKLFVSVPAKQGLRHFKSTFISIKPHIHHFL
jgi:hypothetical protein